MQRLTRYVGVRLTGVTSGNDSFAAKLLRLFEEGTAASAQSGVPGGQDRERLRHGARRSRVSLPRRGHQTWQSAGHHPQLRPGRGTTGR